MSDMNLTLDLESEQLALDLGQETSAIFDTENIPIADLYRNKSNFYSLDGINELADDILLCGLKQNLEVCYDPCADGQFRIISGERRWLALKQLVQEGHQEFDTVTCKVVPKTDKDEEIVNVIIANAYRTKTPQDTMQEVTTLKEVLSRMREEGKTFNGNDLSSGRLRDVIAKILKVSDSTVAQMEAVNNNLSDTWKQELNDNKIGMTTAYELSGLSKEEQDSAHEAFEESGKMTRQQARALKNPTAEKKDEEPEVLSAEELEATEDKPEEKAYRPGDDYDDAHPNIVTSICYKCQRQDICNVKNGATTSCDLYELSDALKKTPEQLEEERQARIDRKTAEKLQQMQADGIIDITEDGPVAHRETAATAISEAVQEAEIRTVIVGKSTYQLLATGEKSYMFDRLSKEDKKYEKGDLLRLQEMDAGEPTGNTMIVKIVYMDTSDTVSDLKEGHVILQLEIIKQDGEEKVNE